jgi:hypothetical protein
MSEVFLPRVHLPSDKLLEHLVRGGKLPSDIALRSYWLPSNRRDEALEQDVLAALGIGDRSDEYDFYLGPEARSPDVVFIPYSAVTVKKVIEPSSEDWLSFYDLKKVMWPYSTGVSPLESKVRGAAYRLWATVVNHMSPEHGAQLEEIRMTPAEPATRAYSGRKEDRYRERLQRMIVKDASLFSLVEISPDSFNVPIASVRVGKMTFNALELILADNHPQEYDNVYRTWSEAVLERDLEMNAPMV